VIVVSYNRAADLKLCLEAIAASTLESFELIVVDNASTENTIDVARSFPNVTLIVNRENLGFAAATNQGLESARGEYVALINNDAVIERNWLAELVSFLDANPRAAAVGGRLYHWNEHNPLGSTANDFFGYSELLPDGSTPAAINPQDPSKEVAFISAAASIVRRDAIVDVGGPFLDPTYFMYYEETDFFARALRKDWRIHFHGAAACWHRIRGGERVAPYRYHYYMHRNRVLFAHRHLDDDALKILMDIARLRALNARVRVGLKIGFQKTEALRARRDAWTWVKGQQAFLQSERARFREFGAPLSAVLAGIQARVKSSDVRSEL
jgi:GT2 family glycosyltransferase